MKADAILQRLKPCEADLRAHGVMHAALLGSVARDDVRLCRDQGLYRGPVQRTGQCGEPGRPEVCCAAESDG